jgi:hypothetical protein
MLTVEQFGELREGLVGPDVRCPSVSALVRSRGAGARAPYVGPTFRSGAPPDSVLRDFMTGE